MDTRPARVRPTSQRQTSFVRARRFDHRQVLLCHLLLSHRSVILVVPAPGGPWPCTNSFASASGSQRQWSKSFLSRWPPPDVHRLSRDCFALSIELPSPRSSAMAPGLELGSCPGNLVRRTRRLVWDRSGCLGPGRSREEKCRSPGLVHGPAAGVQPQTGFAHHGRSETLDQPGLRSQLLGFKRFFLCARRGIVWHCALRKRDSSPAHPWKHVVERFRAEKEKTDSLYPRRRKPRRWQIDLHPPQRFSHRRLERHLRV